MRNFSFIHANDGETGLPHSTRALMRLLNDRFLMANREKIILAYAEAGPTISKYEPQKGFIVKLTNLLGGGRGIIAALVLFGATAAASEITFDIGASTGVKKGVSVPFAALSGTSLQGQTLSINFVFGTGHFGRLFTASDSSLTAGLTLNTSSAGLAGFLDGTGYLFDLQGQQMIPLEAPQQLGSASTGNGVMFASLFPLQAGGLNRPLDFFGIHFDLILPNNPSVLVSANSSFNLFFADNNPNARFGIGPGIPSDIVPEGTATLFLFSVGVAAVVFGRICLAKAS